MFPLQDMISRVNKKNISVLLFLVFFASYSSSPLTYRFHGQYSGESTCSSGKPSLSAGNIRIFLWELVCARFSAATDDPDSQSAPSVLIKKSRAVMPQNIFAKLIPLREITLTIDLCLFLLLLSLFPLKDGSALYTRSGFAHLCRDRSPPYRGLYADGFRYATKGLSCSERG
jgi:hypothetical protein